MSTSWEYSLAAIILVGSIFALVGSIGLIKLPEFCLRLHSPTKATTVGVGALLLASVLYFYQLNGKISVNEILIALFLFLTAPISAHFMARAYLHVQKDQVAEQIPPPVGPAEWAVYDSSASSENES